MGNSRAMASDDANSASRSPGEPMLSGYRGNDMGQPGRPAHMSRGPRSLFPLPFSACPPAKVGGCRTVQRRRARICKEVENVNEAIWSLNWMAGCNDREAVQHCSPMQSQVVQRVDGLVHSQKPSGCIPTPEGALKELLHGASPYDFKPINETLASYRSELVSLPSDIHGCPNLVDILHDDDRRFLEEKSELMLRPAMTTTELDEVCKVYWDPKLKFNQKAYQGLVKKLHAIGYFTYTTEPACEVGVFFVWKSSRTKLRMITDARRANACFHEPPSVALMTGEGMGRIEVELDGSAWMSPEVAEAMSIVVGLSDVRDCFHRMRVPAWLARFFAWRPVPAKVVGLQGVTLEGKTLGPLDPVFPCAGSLCQGFSWSLYFAQRANEAVCRSMSSLHKANLVNDRGGPLVMKVGVAVEDKPHFYVYVDNLGVVGSSEPAVQSIMKEMQTTFNGLGLELHASEISSGYVESLGCVVEGKVMRSRVNPKRMWKVHQGIVGLLRRGKSSGRALEVVIGHATFCALMNRWLLSTFHTVYAFIQKHYHEAASLWPSVRDELRAFAGLLFLNAQDWWRQWNSAVTSSDASLTGYGVCESWWKKQLVASVARVQERSRFRRLGGHSARESALGAAGFFFDGKDWKKFSRETAKRFHEAGWGLSQNFQEVPAFALRREHWKPKLWGKWKHEENIVLLEARGVLKAIKRLALTRYGHGMRHLHLCDNLGVVLSIERCRSRNYRLLKILRCIGAYCLSRNIFLAIRWIPSELNVSDEPSRLHDLEESKLLIDLVDVGDDCFLNSQAPSFQHGPQAHPKTQQQCRSADNSKAAAKVEDEEALSALRNSSLDKEGSLQVSGAGREEFFDEALDRKAGSSLGIACDRVSTQKAGSYDTQGFKATGRSERLRRQHVVRMAGRAKRRTAAFLAKEAKKASSGNGGDWNGNWSKHSGSGGCIFSGPGTIQETFHGIRQVSDSGKCFNGSSSWGGQSSGEMVQSEISGRGRKPFWRLHHGGIDGQMPRLQQAWLQEGAHSVESSQGMAQIVSISLEACIPASGVVCGELANDGAWPHTESPLQPPPGLDIPQAWSSPGFATGGFSASYSSCDQPLVGCHFTDRDFASVEGGGQGRQHSSGLKLVGFHRSSVTQSENRPQDREGLELQLQRVSDSVSAVLQGASPEPSAVPGASQWTEYRSGKKGKKPRRSSEAWLLVDKKVSGSVRESREVGSHLAQAGCQRSDELPGSGKAHRGHHARPRISTHSFAPVREDATYLADFFSGSGGVARAARAAGFKTREWEILHGPDYDLTRPAVLWKIREDIHKGRIFAAMLAPPCSSFSPARDRTRVIRSRSDPWGLSGLPPHELAKVRIGNQCFRAALKIIRWLDEHKIPWILENPHSSKCWFLPPLVHLQNASHVQTSVCDFCQYGTNWRKRTRFLAGNLDECDLGRIQRRCQAQAGWCSRSGKKHFQLTGSNSKGVPWTRVAQPYPAQLCHHLAHALTAHRRCVIH